MITRAVPLVLVVLALVSCSTDGPPPPPPDPTTILHERILAPDVMEPLGWLEAESIDDHALTITADPTARHCDGDYSAALASPGSRSTASRAYINGDTVLQIRLVSEVDAATFAALRSALEECDGVTTSLTIDDLPGAISSSVVDLGLPGDAITVEAIIVTPMITQWLTTMFARGADDTLVTAVLTYPTFDDVANADLFERVLAAARA